MTEKRQILQFASAITLATVISRILGYIRDQRITLLLGTSFAADPFILAFRIPNLLRRMVGEGAMTAAFIPIFTAYIFGESRGGNLEVRRAALLGSGGVTRSRGSSRRHFANRSTA